MIYKTDQSKCSVQMNLQKIDQSETLGLNELLYFFYYFRAIRYYAGEQIYLMMSYSHTQAPLLNCVSLLFNVLNDDMVTENGANTYEYFRVSNSNVIFDYT